MQNNSVFYKKKKIFWISLSYWPSSLKESITKKYQLYRELKKVEKFLVEIFVKNCLQF